MTLPRVSLLPVYACVYLATLISATEPPRTHEARQGGPITSLLSMDPGPESSIQTTPSTTIPSSSNDSPTPSPSDTPSSDIPSSSLSPSATPDPQPSSSMPQPSPAPSPGILDFTVQTMTTCTSGLISWHYTGQQQAPLFLSITNIGVPQYDALLHIKARQNTVNSTLQQQLVDTDTSVPSWTWPSVNVTQGWYKIQGLVLSEPNVKNNSLPFFIANGTDVSCLAATSPQASFTSTSTSTASPSASVLTTSVGSTSNMGSVVGGIVGASLAVALAIFAGLWLWSRRRKRLFIERGRKHDRTWGSLKSTTSSIRPRSIGTPLNGNPFHAHAGSTGAILLPGARASVTTTSGGSDEDAIVVSEEKLVSPASSSGMSPFDVLSTPVHYDHRISTYTVQTPTSSTASESFRSRIPSIRTSNQSLEQQAQRIRSSMETSGRRRSGRLSMPTLPSPTLSRVPHSPTPAQPKEEYPLTPLTLTPVNRSISAGAVSAMARRTSRKPVPQYNSSILLEDKNADTVSTLTVGAESSQSHGTGLGTGSHGTASDSTSKTSLWDGRPVHYLIPDVPPPQHD